MNENTVPLYLNQMKTSSECNTLQIIRSTETPQISYHLKSLVASYLPRTAAGDRDQIATSTSSRTPSLSFSLSRVKVHNDVQSTRTITIKSQTSVLSKTCVFRLYDGFLCALRLSVFSSCFPFIDRCFARVNAIYSSLLIEAWVRSAKLRA